MISRAYITEWRFNVPWQSDSQIEQDLILNRIIISIFSNELLFKHLRFRGGTALHKLYLFPSTRYSEDIDLVQREAIPIGKLMTEIRKIINPILGKPKWTQNKGRVTFRYSVKSEIPPIEPLKFKIEINTREHFNVYKVKEKEFNLNSRWFSGKCQIPVYSLEELLGTKMRALYQRTKGRDLFDLWYGLTKGKANPEKIIKSFKTYIKFQGISISQKQFINNLQLKVNDSSFINDTKFLLRSDVSYNIYQAYELIIEELIKKII